MGAKLYIYKSSHKQLLARLLFEHRKTEIESRQTIEEFLGSIDEDLLKYADSFRKHGFTSNTTMKYITEKKTLQVSSRCPKAIRG